MTGPLLVCALLCGVGVVLCGYGLKYFKQRRPITACYRLLSGTGVLALALSLGAAGANILTYRLVYEQNLAALSFRKLAEQTYEVALSVESTGITRYFSLAGDEWQLDARVLKFHGLANLLGFNTRYRLERLSGRYLDIEAELTKPRTVHSLARSDKGLDLWKLASKYPVPGVDASYGSAAYLPMRDNAQFRVQLTQSGLVARPVNRAGKLAIDDWRATIQ